MSKSLVPAVAALLLSLPMTAVMAQTGSQSTPPGAQQQQQQRSDATAQRKISEYFERNIYLADGTEVGEIEDLLLDASNRIVAAVVEVESRLGIGERRVAIPLESMSIETDRLVLNLTAEQLGRLPTHEDGGR